jgi:NAD(P)-dependent dehydrogenase (short-subunit alcohol dehydrogenase family)
MNQTGPSNLFDLAGKTAVVTGSSRGIGRAIAYRMAQHGARVTISSRKAPACDLAAGEINAVWPDHAIAAPADLADIESLERMVARASQAFGAIDILVCNASISPHFGSLTAIEPAIFRRIFEINVMANHWLINRVVPGMIARGGGAIIIISSMGAPRGSPTFGAYTVSKAAGIQLARSYAVELGCRDIRVNCIAPGLIRTDMARKIWNDAQLLETVLSGTPLSRIGEADEVAGAAVYLASAAGRHVTGQTLIVDGGTTATLPGV